MPKRWKMQAKAPLGIPLPTALAEAALAEVLADAALDELLDVQPNRPRAATRAPAKASAITGSPT